MTASQYLINSESRTFIREYNNAYNKYDFYACTVADTLAKENGDISSEYYPDFKYEGRFVESATIIGTGSRPSINIIGRIPRTFNSELYKLSNTQVSANIQLHFGRCYNPTIFNDFDEAVILEDARVISYSSDKIGSLDRGENAIINETVSVSVGYWYSIHKLAYYNIGSKIIADGYNPLSMDILDCEDCASYGNQICDIFVLAYNLLNPLTSELRIYITENNGKTWRYVALPLDVFDPILIAAPLTTLTVFKDYLYIHLKTDTSESRLYSMPTSDILINLGVWTLVSTNGENDNIPSSDRIVKFKDNYYAPYVHDITYLYAVTSRIVKFGVTVDGTYTVNYIPRFNSIPSGEGMYHDIPLYLVNYQNKILFSGIFIGVPSLDTDPRQLYIAFTTDGINWIEVPIVVDGVKMTGTGSQYIHITPINDKHWVVTVQNDTGTNLAYVTLNGGRTWKAIPAAFKDNGFLVTYAPTESVLFSDIYRSYDSGISAVALPDNGSDYEYSPIISSAPSEHGDSHARAFGCMNDPNQVFTYGNDGIFLFI